MAMTVIESESPDHSRPKDAGVAEPVPAGTLSPPAPSQLRQRTLGPINQASIHPALEIPLRRLPPLPRVTKTDILACRGSVRRQFFPLDAGDVRRFGSRASCCQFTKLS